MIGGSDADYLNGQSARRGTRDRINGTAGTDRIIDPNSELDPLFVFDFEDLLRRIKRLFGIN